MEAMTKRIITACRLDAGAVAEYGTDEYHIDEGIKNLQDLDGIYADYVKGCGDPQLVADFQQEFLHWNIGEKVVFEGTEDEWEDTKGEDDWDFPQCELAKTLPSMSTSRILTETTDMAKCLALNLKRLVSISASRAPRWKTLLNWRAL